MSRPSWSRASARIFGAGFAAFALTGSGVAATFRLVARVADVPWSTNLGELAMGFGIFMGLVLGVAVGLWQADGALHV